MSIARPPFAGLGNREREIMDALYRLGSGSAADVLRLLPNPPNYSTVRKMLSLLEDKGFVRHSKEARRYIYEPVMREEAARRSALGHLLQTFFAGSEELMVTTLVRTSRLSQSERNRIARLIRNGG